MREFSLSEFLGRGWTDQALIELGIENLDRIIPLLRNEEQRESHSVGYAGSSLALIKGKTAADLAKVAEQAIDYTALKSTLPIKSDATHRFDGTGLNYGKTTFKQCGGCEHASSWGAQVGCRFFGHLKSDGEREYAPYDSPCRLLAEGETERLVTFLEKKIELELEKQKAARKITRDWIDRLLAAKKVAKSRPLLPYFRKKDHYRFGDRVRVYTGFPKSFQAEGGMWAPATYLRATDSWACVFLDQELVMTPPRWYHGPDVREEWKSVFWQADLGTGFILQSRDLAILDSLKADDALLALWMDCTRDPNAHKVLGFGPLHHLPPAGPGKRMMSAHEARLLLDLRRFPESVEQVMTALALARKVKDWIDPVRFEQAKSTLLARLHGGKSFAD